MRVLVYKRTHVGDPDAAGRFGIHDCMGRVRAWSYDAVIGVGGVGGEPGQHRIAGKVTWVGIGPHKHEVGKRGPLVTFDRFALFDSDGPRFIELAPGLAARIYGRHVRATVVDGTDPEVARILALLDAPPPQSAAGVVATANVARPHRSSCSRPQDPPRRSGRSCS